MATACADSLPCRQASNEAGSCSENTSFKSKHAACTASIARPSVAGTCRTICKARIRNVGDGPSFRSAVRSCDDNDDTNEGGTGVDGRVMSSAGIEVDPSAGDARAARQADQASASDTPSLIWGIEEDAGGARSHRPSAWAARVHHVITRSNDVPHAIW